MEKNLLLEQGLKIAKYEGMKKEIEMIRELIDLAIENRDRVGFEFLKEKHNILVSHYKKQREEIEKNMEEIDKMMKNKIDKMIDNISLEEILEYFSK